MVKLHSFNTNSISLTFQNFWHQNWIYFIYLSICFRISIYKRDAVDLLILYWMQISNYILLSSMVFLQLLRITTDLRFEYISSNFHIYFLFAISSTVGNFPIYSLLIVNYSIFSSLLSHLTISLTVEYFTIHSSPIL